MSSDQKDEIFACFDKKDLANFHTGDLSSIIFPMLKKNALKKRIPRIQFNLIVFTKENQLVLMKKLRNNGEKESTERNFMTLSGFIHYISPFSYSSIENEIKHEFKVKFSSILVHFRLIDFIFDEAPKEGPILTYYYLALNLDKNSLKNGEFIDENELKNSFDKVVCDKNYKKIWEKVLDNNLQVDLINQIRNSQNQEKLIQIGAIVGRFQPFHNGHLQLILTIFSEVDFIKIGIGSSQYSNTMYNPFSYDERKEFIIRSLRSVNIGSDRYEIYPLPDLHNMKKWVAKVLDVFGNFNIFYSNNDWIRQLFKKSGKMVGDKHLFDFKHFNGSNIREMICDNKTIQDLVPISVFSYLKEIEGIKRVKNLSQLTFNS